MLKNFKKSSHKLFYTELPPLYLPLGKMEKRYRCKISFKKKSNSVKKGIAVINKM